MIKSFKNIPLENKRVLCRVDYNVPMVGSEIKDDTRIIRSLPTIKLLLEKKALIILVSHLGRPKNIDLKFSLKPIAKHLSLLLGKKVIFSPQTIGHKTKSIIQGMSVDTYRVVLLENTRFNPGETKNDKYYSKQLAGHADIFVSDAFGTAHRAHSSTVGITRYLPGYAGLLVEEEYSKITTAMEHPSRPALAIIGGAKISTKLKVIKNLIDVVDTIIIAGGMGYTFLKSKGIEIGTSLFEKEMINTAFDFIEFAKKRNVKLLLPIDVRLSRSIDEAYLEENKAKVVNIAEIPKDMMGLDIGPESEKLFVDKIKNANTIIWNGPVGVFEKELYREGTLSIAKAILDRQTKTIIGGGDTAYALKLLSKDKIPDVIHVSTGGGATLELLSGNDLPGLACLNGRIHK